MALAGTIVFANATKTQLFNTGNVYVYRSHTNGTSKNSFQFDVFVDRGSHQYPQKPSNWFQTFTRLYDALKRYNDFLGLSPIDIIPSTTSGTHPTTKVDSFRHGGRNAGG